MHYLLKMLSTVVGSKLPFKLSFNEQVSKLPEKGKIWKHSGQPAVSQRARGVVKVQLAGAVLMSALHVNAVRCQC